MADTVELSNTTDLLCFPVSSGSLRFHVKAVSDRASLLLLTKPDLNSFSYRIELYHGRDEDVCTIYAKNTERLAHKSTPHYLSNEDYRTYWVTWHGHQICVGKGDDTSAFITARADKTHLVMYVAQMRIPGGQCLWKFELAPPRPPLKQMKVSGGEPEWKDLVDGDIPVDAIIAGHENGLPVYCIRSQHRDSMVIGKLVFGETTGYVPWGGDANPKNEYQILCGYNIQWEATTGDAPIPPLAVKGGIAEFTREVLYVGRVSHEGHLIPGKIQPSHKHIYIAYEGKEHGKEAFEVMVVSSLPYVDRHAVRLEHVPANHYELEDSDEENNDLEHW